ncbi:hypothetical protein, partial [Lysobacter sp. A289]
RTLSKIIGTGLSAAFLARHRSGQASRTSYSGSGERQHLVRLIFYRCPGALLLRRADHLNRFSGHVNTS